MISSSQAKTMINDKKSYHSGMQRNGWVVPNIKSRICTIEFFEAVRKGLVYCPRYDQLIMKPCPDPPSKTQANEELVRVINDGIHRLEDPNERKRFQNLVEQIKVPGMVDLQWILLVLSTITEGAHEYF